METQVTSWLNEGLAFWSAGDAARALEAWYRILEVEPEHPAALEYVAFVREAVHGEAAPVDAASTAADVVEAAVEPAPVPVRRSDSVDSFSWADLVGSDAMPAPAAPAPVVVPAPLLPSSAQLEETAPVPAFMSIAQPPLRSDQAPITADITVEAPVAAEPVVDVVDDVDAIEVDAVDAPADDALDVSMADDEEEARALPSIIIADDAHLPDEPEAAVDVDVEVAEPVPPAPIEVTPRLPSSLLASVGVDDEVMPAPDDVSAARNVPRRHTPMAITPPPPPPLNTSFDELMRSAPPSTDSQKVPAIAVASVVLDAPVIDLPRAATPLSSFSSLPPTTVPLEDRVIRQSIRFDEPRATARSPSPEPQSPVVPAEPEPEEITSPWDDSAGPAEALDLDVTARPPSSFDGLLKAASPSTLPEPVAPEMASSPIVVIDEPPPAPIDELEALMTGARELFELGDFSGSLELVEKVLRTNPQHEGALAYLKRNEATLMRMYESKIGDMSRIPKPLVPPDEVIWMNMHHRAGFILSQVDGTLSYDDLLDVSGMDRFDTVRIVADLVSAGIIG